MPFKSLFLSNRLFYILGGIIALFIIGSFFNLMVLIAQLALGLTLVMVGVEVYALYATKGSFDCQRQAPKRLSNGDPNDIYIDLSNHYRFDIGLRIIDEIPVQFQRRDVSFSTKIKKNGSSSIAYTLRPTSRGTYSFGHINCYLSVFLHLIQRRFVYGEADTIPVYPSFIKLHHKEFNPISPHLRLHGVKKIRKVGHNYEFDQIRDFVSGDDYRAINWTATARTNAIMVNQYQDEKSQDIYAIIDKGRPMKMAFDGLSLLDHAINSSLIMLNTALEKDDNPGLVTFNRTTDQTIIANRRRNQLNLILEALYNQQTQFSHSDYRHLLYHIRHKIKKRSLIFLYTNFESISSLEREIAPLHAIAKRHRLIVIFFKNTGVNELINTKTRNVEEVYAKTIAIKFNQEKELIKSELNRHGIDAILTSPSKLTVDTINKYLELKARQLV